LKIGKPHTQHARLLGVLEHSVSASSGVKVVDALAEEEVEERIEEVAEERTEEVVEEVWDFTATAAAA
jgi:hypothetical protein